MRCNNGDAMLVVQMPYSYHKRRFIDKRRREGKRVDELLIIASKVMVGKGKWTILLLSCPCLFFKT